MTLRNRVTLAAGFAVLLAVIGLSVTVHIVVRANLRDQIDESLRHGVPEDHGVTADELSTSAGQEHVPLIHESYMQLVDRYGEVVATFDDRPLPVTAAVLTVARGEQDEAFFDADVDGRSVRVYVTPSGEGQALLIGRSLEEVEQAMHRLFIALMVISVASVGIAALLGRAVAAAAASPVRRVAEAAESVAETGDLSHHIDIGGGNDLDRLAHSFNAMLDTLSDSLARQRQLVADASHELRTPLATVRTNVEVLQRVDELAPEERTALIRDTVAQIGELTRLVNDLVELARGDQHEEPFVDIDLARLAQDVAAAAGRNHPSVTFRVDAATTHVRANPARLTRAITNLVDNAAKWSLPGDNVEITVDGGVVTVSDHGPGIDPADLPHVFDRFYRSPRARTMPGSGLGLAIVKQVADSHGATITANNRPDRGARFVLQFAAPPPAAPSILASSLPNSGNENSKFGLSSS